MEDARRKVSVVLDEDLAQALATEARRDRGTLSSTIRKVVADWAAQRRAPAGRAA
jgi:macrodomain Ter protein organizer (MatP/YcbG family)